MFANLSFGTWSILIVYREKLQNFKSPNGLRRGLDFIALYKPDLILNAKAITQGCKEKVDKATKTIQASKVVPRSSRQIGAWPNCGTAATKGQLISEWGIHLYLFPFDIPFNYIANK